MHTPPSPGAPPTAPHTRLEKHTSSWGPWRALLLNGGLRVGTTDAGRLHMPKAKATHTTRSHGRVLPFAHANPGHSRAGQRHGARMPQISPHREGGRPLPVSLGGRLGWAPPCPPPPHSPSAAGRSPAVWRGGWPGLAHAPAPAAADAPRPRACAAGDRARSGREPGFPLGALGRSGVPTPAPAWGASKPSTLPSLLIQTPRACEQR